VKNDAAEGQWGKEGIEKREFGRVFSKSDTHKAKVVKNGNSTIREKTSLRNL